MSNEDSTESLPPIERDTMSRPTIYDVADEAKVSIATVSRVVNRTPGVRASTRTRVEMAVSKLRYVPNPQAQALRRSSSDRPLSNGVAERFTATS